MTSHSGAQNKENSPSRLILPLFKMWAFCSSWIFCVTFLFSNTTVKCGFSGALRPTTPTPYLQHPVPVPHFHGPSSSQRSAESIPEIISLLQSSGRAHPRNPVSLRAGGLATPFWVRVKTFPPFEFPTAISAQNKTKVLLDYSLALKTKGILTSTVAGH